MEVVPRVTAARQLALAAATADVLDAMARAGIRTVMLKGAAIATRLYENPATRPAGDVDLLVEPSLAPSAARVLEGLGFHDPLSGTRPHERAAHAVSFRRGGPLPACVDLHRTLSWCNYDPEALWREFSHATTFIHVADRSVEVLEDHAQALVIAAHAVQHGRATKPREDLRRALERYDRGTWVKAALIARRLEAEDVLAAGLRLSDAGARMADSLELGATKASVETRLRLAGSPPVAFGLMRLVQTRSIRGRLMLVLSELFPTPQAMRAYLGFARRGRTALAIAYLYRPLWLTMRLPGALVAYHQASRPR